MTDVYSPYTVPGQEIMLDYAAVYEGPLVQGINGGLIERFKDLTPFHLAGPAQALVISEYSYPLCY